MLQLRPLAAPVLSVLTTAAFLPGCGSPDTAALKTQLSGVADAIDRCVTKTNDARACTKAEKLGALPDGAELGTGTGQIAIEASRPLRYAITAKAGSSTTFAVVAEPVGARKRMCMPAGKGDCPKSGAW